MNSLPAWITFNEIRRFEALKADIFREGPFVLWDAHPDMEEYNLLSLKIMKLRNHCRVMAQAEENRLSYGGHAKR